MLRSLVMEAMASITDTSYRHSRGFSVQWGKLVGSMNYAHGGGLGRTE